MSLLSFIFVLVLITLAIFIILSFIADYHKVTEKKTSSIHTATNTLTNIPILDQRAVTIESLDTVQINTAVPVPISLQNSLIGKEICFIHKKDPDIKGVIAAFTSIVKASKYLREISVSFRPNYDLLYGKANVELREIDGILLGVILTYPNDVKIKYSISIAVLKE